MAQQLAHSFRIGHQSIVENLSQLQAVARSYQIAKPVIRELRERLLNHFGKQNDALFDSLRSYYSDDRESLKILEFLTHNLKDIKVKYIIFFEKHSGEMADMSSKSFPVDFYGFSKDVLAHIKLEEEYLLPLLEKLRIGKKS